MLDSETIKDLSQIAVITFSKDFNDRMQNVNFRYSVANTVYSFRSLYYDTFIWSKMKYMGIETMKFPTDLWVTQEIIYDTKPDLLIETGTWTGGSALYYAHLFDAIGKGEVITIDNMKKENLPEHPRIKYIVGDCLSAEVTDKIRESLNGHSVMVNLDSCHDKPHVLKEMEIYSRFVTVGKYMIVEDSLLNHPVKVKDSNKRIIFPGPMEAIDEFIPKHKEFSIDKTKEKYLLTSNPNGYIVRRSCA